MPYLRLMYRPVTRSKSSADWRAARAISMQKSYRTTTPDLVDVSIRGTGRWSVPALPRLSGSRLPGAVLMAEIRRGRPAGTGAHDWEEALMDACVESARNAVASSPLSSPSTAGDEDLPQTPCRMEFFRVAWVKIGRSRRPPPPYSRDAKGGGTPEKVGRDTEHSQQHDGKKYARGRPDALRPTFRRLSVGFTPTLKIWRLLAVVAANASLPGVPVCKTPMLLTSIAAANLGRRVLAADWDDSLTVRPPPGYTVPYRKRRARL